MAKDGPRGPSDTDEETASYAPSAVSESDKILRTKPSTY